MGTGLDLKEEWLWESPLQSTRHCRHWGSLSTVTSVYAPEPTHLSINTPVRMLYCTCSTFNVHTCIITPHSSVLRRTPLVTEEYWQWQRVWESTTRYRVWSKSWVLHVIHGGRRERRDPISVSSRPGTWLYDCISDRQCFGQHEGGVALGKVLTPHSQPDTADTEVAVTGKIHLLCLSYRSVVHDMVMWSYTMVYQSGRVGTCNFILESKLLVEPHTYLFQSFSLHYVLLWHLSSVHYILL